MPKTNLDLMNYSAATVRKVIGSRLGELEWSKPDLAEKIQMPRSTFYDRWQDGLWTAEDLYNIIYVTRMPQQDVLRIFGKGTT